MTLLTDTKLSVYSAFLPNVFITDTWNVYSLPWFSDHRWQWLAPCQRVWRPVCWLAESDLVYHPAETRSNYQWFNKQQFTSSSILTASVTVILKTFWDNYERCREIICPILCGASTIFVHFIRGRWKNEETHKHKQVSDRPSQIWPKIK